MDLLRFFKSIPFLFLKLFSKIFKLSALLLKLIVGDVRWNSPVWLPYIKKALKFSYAKIRKHLKAVLITLAVVIVVSFGSYYGYVWQQNKPKPIDVAPLEQTTYSANLQAPYITNYYNDNLTFNPLVLYFNGDVAPIGNVGKEVVEGVSISPNVKGKWTWSSVEQLSFQPESDWAVGQTFTIKLNPKVLLAKQALLDAVEYSFSTKEFSAYVNSAELYQNPEKPSEKNVIFEVDFTHPVDVASFEKQISLKLVAPEKYKISPKPYKFVVQYNEKKLKAWIRSEFVTLPEVDSDMQLLISKGVKSSLGGNEAYDISSTQRVTSVYRDVVDNLFLTLAENENNEQEQVLVVELVDGVNIENLSKQIKAWVLPKDKPKKGNDTVKENYRWSSYDDIDAVVLASSTPLTLIKDEIESNVQSVVSFKYKTSPKNYIYVSVGKDIETVGGYRAKNTTRAVLNVPEYPKVLAFANDGVLLSLNGERKVTISSRNVPAVRLDIKRVIPSQIQHLINFGRGYEDFKDSSSSYSTYFTESFSHTQNITFSNPGKVVYTGIDLSAYLLQERGGKQGVFLLSLKSWDNATNSTFGEAVSRLIVVTDLGVLVKSSVDGTSDVFVQSISENKPSEGVKVSVLGRNGIVLVSGITDKNGHVHFKDLREFRNEKTPTVYIAEKGGDLSFLQAANEYNDRVLDFSRFDIGGVENVLEQGKLGAYLFSERGLYRPGDTVNIGTIVRAESWDIALGGIPVVATVYDPRGHVFKEVSFTLDESGFNELSFTTTEGSPTGSWSVYLRIAEDYKNNLKAGIFLGSTTVAVREFEPDRMKAELRLTPSAVKGWVKPDELSATLKAENLFGAPAQERRVSSTLILNPVEFHFGEHQNYHFYDGFSISGRDKFEISLEDTTTDERGEANLSLLLHEHERASYHLSIIANAFEAGSGRSVTATAQTSISPNDYLVGAKADGDVGYIKKGVERTLNFIAVNQNLDKIDLGNLSIEIVEQKYISVLTLQNSGVYKYQSKLQEVQLSKKAFAISKNGTDYRLDSKKPATYKLLVKNAQGDILYKSYYGIVGDANIDRSLERNSELELKLSKAEYKNGEEIEISINTPYIGSGLITIEKDKVYAWKWFKTTTTSSIQKITVPAELKGNGYVNVQFVRDPNSNDIFMSPLSYGVLPFKVNQQSKSAHVELVSTKLAKPGNDINFSVKTNGKQKVVVFAVDEGILQVADYHLNNPLGFFFQKRYLGVRSHQILDLILPEFSKFETLASAAGGGDDVQAAEANKHLNPFKRKVDKPVVFWSGIVEVNGEKQFSYKVPDYFNGKLRVMAVAVSPKQIGIAQSSSTVRDDFVLSPNVPFVAAPNDEFEVTLGVSNNIENLNKTLPINVSLVASEHLQIVGNSTAVINLAQMSEGFVKFRLKATKHLGSGDLIFRANYEDKESKKSYFTQRIGTISVRPVTPFRTVSVMGRMGKESESVKDMRSMYDEYALRDASVGFTPMVLSNGLFSYLENYPHYCSEQLVSQAISAMIADKYSPQSAKIQHENVASILKSRQNSNGAIGLWRATAYGDSFVSVYAAHYLIEAQENGIVISSDILQNLNSYLSDLANYDDAEDIEGLRLRAYALYLLTRQGVITTNTLSSVQKALQLHSEKTWQNDISALYIAATYKMLKMDKEADLLLSKAWKELGRAYDNAWWSRDYYDPLVINSAAIYLISKHFPQKLKSIPPQALENIVLMIRSGRFTTTSSAMSVLAIDSYSAQLEEFSKNSKDNKSLSIEAISADNLTRVISTHNGLITSANFTKKDVGITFKNPLKLPAWYSVVQEGYDENVSAQAIKKGLEVYREFKDESGNQISTLKLGDKVNVTIRVRSNSNEGVGNVAIIDLLPGGFEVVQQPLKQQDYADDEYEDEYDDDDSFISPIAFGATTLDVDYSDIREDRVIIYARVGKDIGEFTYQIKPTNVGTYRIPPVFAEAMYDREIQGVSAENGTITVLAVE